MQYKPYVLVAISSWLIISCHVYCTAFNKTHVDGDLELVYSLSFKEYVSREARLVFVFAWPKQTNIFLEHSNF